MSLHNFGIPDLPERAFIRCASGQILPQGGKGSKPKVPDYESAARAEAQGNLDLAKYATQANRVNQYTPWGSLTWTNDRSFDQAGYDAAMQTYLNAQQSQASNQQQYQPNPYMYTTGSPDSYWGVTQPYAPLGGYGKNQPQLEAPNAEDFWSGGDNWTQNVELSPEMQAMLDQQNKIQQGLFGAQDAALGRVNDAMSQPFNMAGLPSAGSALNMSGLPRMGQALNMNMLPEMGQAFQASGEGLDIYDPELQTNNATDLILSRVNPQLDQQQEALRAQLANQGIVQGTEAYDRAMMQHQQGRNDAYNQAALSGIGLGMQQQGMMFDQSLANRGLLAGEADLMYGHQQGLRHGEASLQNQQFTQQQQLRQLEAALQAQQFAQQQQLRQQGFQEQAYERNLPMQELSALTGGGQVQMPQFPGYAQQATTAGPNLLGAAQQQYQSQLGSYNAQQAGQSSMFGGLLGVGSLALGAGALFGGAAGGLSGIGTVPPSLMAGIPSDRRLKKNIKRVGKADNGLNIYSYQYVWGGPFQIGYMADEVENVAPHAVGQVGGFKTVHYGAI